MQLNGIPGALGRFLGFWAVFLQSAFSYLGTEVVALVAAEAENPRKTIPRATKSVAYRIGGFYVLGVFVIGLTVPSTNERLLDGSGTATASPFVIAIEVRQMGLLTIAELLLTRSCVHRKRASKSCPRLSTPSSSFPPSAPVSYRRGSDTPTSSHPSSHSFAIIGNSYLYAASRTIYSLAVDKQAPKIFARTTAGGLPIFAVAVTVAFAALSYMNVSTNGATVFNCTSLLAHYSFAELSLTSLALRTRRVLYTLVDYRYSHLDGYPDHIPSFPRG